MHPDLQSSNLAWIIEIHSWKQWVGPGYRVKLPATTYILQWVSIDWLNGQMKSKQKSYGSCHLFYKTFTRVDNFLSTSFLKMCVESLNLPSNRLYFTQFPWAWSLGHRGWGRHGWGVSQTAFLALCLLSIMKIKKMTWKSVFGRNL